MKLVGAFVLGVMFFCCGASPAIAALEAVLGLYSLWLLGVLKGAG